MAERVAIVKIDTDEIVTQVKAYVDERLAQGGDLRREDPPLPELDAYAEVVAAAVVFVRGLLTFTNRHPQSIEHLRAALDKVAPGWRDT